MEEKEENSENCYRQKLSFNLYEVCDFLNKNEIKREDIVAIFPKGEKIALIYYGKKG